MTEIGPGSGQGLFEMMEQQNVCPSKSPPGAYNDLVERDFESLCELADSLWMASPFRWSPFSGAFSFLASSSLSGEGTPCFDGRCRVNRARALARFAGLYADTVLIRDPFEKVLYGEDSAQLRVDFPLTLIVLEALRPEIEAGIVAFAPAVFPLCENGLREFRRVQDAIHDRVFDAAESLFDDVLDGVDVTLHEGSAYQYVRIANTDRFLAHEGFDVVPTADHPGERRSRLTSQDITEIVTTWIMDPTLIDLQFYQLIQWLYDARYLTDRPLDGDLLHALGEPRPPHTAQVNMQITHTLPFVDGLSSETLLKMRRDEGEAFRVYRDRVRSLMEAAPASPRLLREAFRDLIEPELNRIDKAVDSARRMVKDDIREKLIFGIGTVTLGIAAGTITPQIGTILATLGGGKFGTDILGSLNRLFREPREARESDFFFLWKAREAAKHEHVRGKAMRDELIGGK